MMETFFQIVLVFFFIGGLLAIMIGFDRLSDRRRDRKLEALIESGKPMYKPGRYVPLVACRNCRSFNRTTKPSTCPDCGTFDSFADARGRWKLKLGTDGAYHWTRKIGWIEFKEISEVPKCQHCGLVKCYCGAEDYA